MIVQLCCSLLSLSIRKNTPKSTMMGDEVRDHRNQKQVQVGSAKLNDSGSRASNEPKVPLFFFLSTFLFIHVYIFKFGI